MTTLAVVRRRSGSWIPPVVVFVAVLLLWEQLFLYLDVKTFLIPRPSVIWSALVDQWPTTLLRGILYTGTEAILGLLVGVSLGTLLGLGTSRWATVRDTLVPLGTGMSTIPIIAFAPIMINWFGFESQLPRITVVALMTFFPVMVNTIRGLTQVDPAALELMDSYAASSFQVLRKVRIPNALPYWFTALRIAVTLSVIGAVVGEFFGGPLYSLGIYVTNQTGSFKYPNAWAAIVLACVLGIGLYLVAAMIERLAMPWRRAEGTAAE
ncbi:MAG TPA: ABC transporter permease [Candidatus Limnocylindrales bacterium]|nr:ABC transporter permease [Candidatus Limnocylindrales bacterium]